MKVAYTPPLVDYGRVRKSNTVPDQTLSIQEIVKRYVRGVPVDILRREPIFSDQQEHDLEKLSRLDFAEKAELADQLHEQALSMQDQLEANERKRSESARKPKPESAAAKPANEGTEGAIA